LFLIRVLRQRAEPPAGGQVEEVTEQSLGAESGVLLILAEAFGDEGQLGKCLVPGEVWCVGLAGSDVRQQFHPHSDRG
jgi:hypothetical protein